MFDPANSGTSWLARVAAFACLVAVLLSAALPARAACVEVARGSDDGIGGMGRGGDDDGIGGMGVYGAITGFGSICVNGLKVELPQSLDVLGVEGVRGIDTLRVGHVVSVDAHRDRGHWVADRVALQPAFAGPMHRVQGDPALVEVLGRRIEVASVASGAMLADVPSGTSVVVYGQHNAQRQVEASLIEVDTAIEGARVWGTARHAASVHRVGSFEVAYAARPVPVAGERIAVAGQWIQQTARLERSRWQPARALVSRQRHVSVEVVAGWSAAGRVLLLDGEVLEVGGLEGVLETLESNERVWFLGHRKADGSIRLDRLDRRPPGPGRGRGRGSDDHPGQGHLEGADRPGKSADAPGHAAGHASSNAARAANATHPGAGALGRPAPVNRPGVQRRVSKPGRPPRPEPPRSPARTRPSKPEKIPKVSRPKRPHPRPEKPSTRGRSGR